MSKTVAELEVQLELATAQFEASAKEFDRELKKMQKNTEKTSRSFQIFERQVKRLGKGLAGLAAGLTVGALAQASREAIEYGDTIAKTADRVAARPQD